MAPKKDIKLSKIDYPSPLFKLPPKYQTQMNHLIVEIKN
jgi:hypothetical protein